MDEIAPDVTPPKRCIMCERVSGIFGLLLGGIILFIAVDVLSGGKLSNLISGPREVTDNDES